MSGDDVAAREAALAASFISTPYHNDQTCRWCASFRAGWDDAILGRPEDSGEWGHVYPDGYVAARAYAKAQATDATR